MSYMPNNDVELSKFEIAFLIIGTFGIFGILLIIFWFDDRKEKKQNE